MTTKTKDAIKTSLTIAGIILGIAVAVKAFIFIAWACYCAGIPM